MRIDCADEKSDGENEIYNCMSSAYKWCLIGGIDRSDVCEGLLREEINELSEIV